MLLLPMSLYYTQTLTTLTSSLMPVLIPVERIRIALVIMLMEVIHLALCIYIPLTDRLSDTDDMSMMSVVLNVSNEGIKDGLFNTNSTMKFRCEHLVNSCLLLHV